MIRLFSLILLWLGLAAISATVQAQTPDQVQPQVFCDDCLQKALNLCQDKCKNAETDFLRKGCTRRCSIRACSKNCGYQQQQLDAEKAPETEEGALSEAHASCDFCMRYMHHAVCEKKCSGKADSTLCEKRCVTRGCAQQCQLPDLPQKKQPQAPDTADACAVCEKSATGPCRSHCGNGKNVTCEVTCVKEKCLPTCRPELF